jgi:hypothetical protein
MNVILVRHQANKILVYFKIESHFNFSENGSSYKKL